MSDPIKFYMDEDIPRAVSEGLRRRGVDVLTTQDADMLGAVPLHIEEPACLIEVAALKVLGRGCEAVNSRYSARLRNLLQCLG